MRRRGEAQPSQCLGVGIAAAVDAELSITRSPGTPLCEVTVKRMREGPEDTKVVSKAKMIPLDKAYLANLLCRPCRYKLPDWARWDARI